MSKTLLKSLTTKEDITDLIKRDYAGKSFAEMEDLQFEIVDSIMPIYYNDIIGEWQAMPADFDGEGIHELGLPQEITVYNLMSNDLYVYYSQLVAEVIFGLQIDGHFDESDN